jgi:protein-S-isoprenylcysteine O-methyltransferase Ste14
LAVKLLIFAATTAALVHVSRASLLCLTWGVFFKNPRWLPGVLALGATLFLVATAKLEEVENARYFGREYLEYARRTKMFIPLMF